MANGFTMSIKNTSDNDTELELFDTAKRGGSVLSLVYGYQYDYNPVLTIGKFDLDSIGIELHEKGGVTTSYTNTYGGETFTKNELQDSLNDPDNETSQVGTWVINKETATACADCYNIQVTLFDNIANLIDTGAADLGAGELNVNGTGVLPDLTLNSTTAPDSTFTHSISSNPAVSLKNGTSFSYSEFSNSAAQRTYNISKFEVFSTNKAQILEPFIFSRTLASGKLYDKVLAPTIDPYQEQNYVITKDEKGYVMDGFTDLKYKILANSEVRIVMEYDYVDIATPLLLKKPKLVKQQGRSEYSNFSTSINPTFEGNMQSGYDKFGCKFLHNRKSALEQKLINVSGASGNEHPKWQEHLKERIDYINNMLIEKECSPDDEAILDRIQSVGPELIRDDLFIPTKDFIEASMGDTEGNIDDTNPNDIRTEEIEFPFEK